MWVVIGCIAAAAVFAVVWIVTHKTIRDAIATDIEGWFKVTPQQVATIPGLAAALGVSVQTTQKVVPTPAPNAVTP
jgi:ribosomal protein L23